MQCWLVDDKWCWVLPWVPLHPYQFSLKLSWISWNLSRWKGIESSIALIFHFFRKGRGGGDFNLIPSKLVGLSFSSNVSCVTWQKPASSHLPNWLHIMQRCWWLEQVHIWHHQAACVFAFSLNYFFLYLLKNIYIMDMFCKCWVLTWRMMTAYGLNFISASILPWKYGETESKSLQILALWYHTFAKWQPPDNLKTKISQWISPTYAEL